MSLIKNIEIDTLKLRNLITRDSQNNPVLSSFQLYAAGDGTTFWSTGVDAQQFINLSTKVNSADSTLQNFESSATSTIRNITSTLEAEVYSSIYSISSFIVNLQNYSINTTYTDAALAQYSTGVESTLTAKYQTIASSLTIFNLGLQNTSTTAAQIGVQIAATNANIVVTNALVARNSTITTSTLFNNMSTYTTSTFTGVFNLQSTNFYTLNSLILANVAYTNNSLNNISTSEGQVVSSITNIPVLLASTIAAASSFAAFSLSTSYVSSVNYTNRSISTLYFSTNTQIAQTQSTLQGQLASTNTALLLSRAQIVSSLISSIYSISTSSGSTLSYFEQNITVLLSTGLTQNIYQTFIDLQAYSANIISGTTSTSNFVINSTNTALQTQSLSSYNGVMESSFLYITNNLYTSTISTILPQMNSTVNGNISASNAFFASTIASTTQYFQLLVNATYVAFTQDIDAYTENYERQISTQIANGLSSQSGLLSTAIVLNDEQLNETLSTYVFTLSSFTYSQYATAPSIIMNRVNNLSTINNVTSVGQVTGLSSLVAGIVNLDTTNYNNFYVLMSDIGNNVFYGLAISTSQAKMNQDFTVQIDIKSTYQNSFFTLDTSNMSRWLNTPPIYNPNSYSLITATGVPKADTVQQIYLSTFIGAYIIEMRNTPMGMFIKNIQSYPFIYTTATFTGSIIIPKNVQVNNLQLAQHSSFVYRGSPLQISWQTNDLNIPLGIKFTGTDLYMRPITSWAGPYNSGLGTANVKVPTPTAPFAKYDMMYLGVYPNTPLNGNNTTSGNSQNLIFASRPIPSSLYVVNPTMNTYIRVLNPGTVNSYLQVNEIRVNNDVNQNVTQVSTNCVFTPDTDAVNINTYPYNGSYTTFGWQNAFDNNPNTYFFGGYTATEINPNSVVAGQFSTTNAFAMLPPAPLQISSIDVVKGPTYSLEGMQLIISNRNEGLISNGLFYSTITLSGANTQSFSFS